MLFMQTVKKNQGFTLIELIMVMVILSILSAVALPKMMNLSDEAEKASLTGLKSALVSAYNLAAQQAVVSIAMEPGSPGITLLDGTIVPLINGRVDPAAIPNLLDFSSDYYAETPPTTASGDSTLSFQEHHFSLVDGEVSSFDAYNEAAGCGLTILVMTVDESHFIEGGDTFGGFSIDTIRSISGKPQFSKVYCSSDEHLAAFDDMVII